MKTDALARQAARECTATQLRRAARAIGAVYDAAMGDTGLYGPQFSLVTALSIAGDVTVSRLAEILALDRTTLTRNLALLERDRLVSTHASPTDRRARIIRLTPHGKAVLERALVAWQRAHARVVAALGEPEWKRLMANLTATVAASEKVAAAPRR